MNGPSYFEIQAADVQRALTFYRDIFGWKFTRAEGMPIEYWRIETGTSHIDGTLGADGPRGGLLKRPAAPPPPMSGTNAFTCSMQVADFDVVSAAIFSHGGTVALPKFAVPGVCWQGYFLDTEGNTFGLFQPDPGAK